MQELVLLRYVLDLQMTFGIVGGEAIVLREREFPIFFETRYFDFRKDDTIGTYTPIMHIINPLSPLVN